MKAYKGPGSRIILFKFQKKCSGRIRRVINMLASSQLNVERDRKAGKEGQQDQKDSWPLRGGARTQGMCGAGRGNLRLASEGKIARRLVRHLQEHFLKSSVSNNNRNTIETFTPKKGANKNTGPRSAVSS